MATKYSPLSSHLRKCQKQFSHIIDHDNYNESEVITLHNLEKDMTSNTLGKATPGQKRNRPEVTQKADKIHIDQHHTVGHNSHKPQLTPNMIVATRSAYTPSSTPHTQSKKGLAKKSHTLSHPQDSESRHTTQPVPAEPREETPTTYRLSPSDLVAGDTPIPDNSVQKDNIMDFNIGHDSITLFYTILL